MNWTRTNRKVHYWGAIVCALPIVLMVGTGVLLMLKKESEWIQPGTVKGTAGSPTLAFDQILTVARSAPQAEVTSWADITRLDVRPSKGVIKIRTRSGWEVQIDQQNGSVLKVAYRRSELIEALHDGSFFHDNVKLGLFLPAGIVLFLLWITGIYMFFFPIIMKRRLRRS